jgi:hypothetical protein
MGRESHKPDRKMVHWGGIKLLASICWLFVKRVAGGSFLQIYD